MKPLEQLNKFFELAAERNLSGSDQLVYLHLYNLLNRAHWTESIQVSDKQLLDLINLHDTNGKPASIETVRRVKQRLKSKGFIDFNSGKGNKATVYRLIKLYPDKSAETKPPAHSSVPTPDYSPKQSPAHSRTASYYTRAKDVEDVEDIEFTTTPPLPPSNPCGDPAPSSPASPSGDPAPAHSSHPTNHRHTPSIGAGLYDKSQKGSGEPPRLKFAM